MDFGIKTLIVAALVCTLLCITAAVAESDISEILAWSIVALYNLRDFVSKFFKP